MTKWNYTLFKINVDADEDRLERELNKMGAEGWELVSAVDAPGSAVHWHSLYFKRPAVR